MNVVFHNGELLDAANVRIAPDNRAFKYGDGAFETMKYTHNKILFWEDHYFRLMSTMRILRMEIPLAFSPEFLEEKILETIVANHAERNACRVRLSVYRAGGGIYTPQTNTIGYLIEIMPMPDAEYVLNEKGLMLDVFKDFYVQKSILSNLKTANAQLYVLASIFRQENGYDECVLVNDDKNVAEAISANIFLVKGEELHTPPLETGCLKGVMRKQVLQLAPKMGLKPIETTFSPFELQKADEVWLTNATNGLRWVGSFRKKKFENAKAKQMLAAINRIAAI